MPTARIPSTLCYHYYPSLLAGSPDTIQCPQEFDEQRSSLVGQYWCIYEREPSGEFVPGSPKLQACLCLG